MQTSEEQRKAHELRQIITERDEFYAEYRKQKPLTKEQKEELLYEAEQIKSRTAKDWYSKEYMEKRYGDSTIKDEENWV